MLGTAGAPGIAAQRKVEFTMFALREDYQRILRLRPRPAWASVWHLWRVAIPRRSIAGRLVHGQVWRRHDGRRWIYKKFIEH
ncbi:hypothetical protein [Tardiphaga sp.]|uniref:hypothetical protein n=1 Tax=Tardiphaga sp. TaxID=1926292 RepID=UPI0025ED33E9|nr:hypothetical protein [Tardiphaga sp.]